MSQSPRVSVLMSVYNGAEFLRPAIDSILGQTYGDFEFIIVNDGSTDGSREIITSYSEPRIRLLDQENRGIVPALNRALAAARGEYVARMDADDLSSAERLRREVDYLDGNPAVVLVGSSFEMLDGRCEKLGIAYALTEDEDLRRELLLRNPFGHGSALIRRRVLQAVGGYRADYEHNEDYDLWRRLAAAGRIANLPSVQYVWRLNSAGISLRNSARQERAAASLRDELWQTHPAAGRGGREMRREAGFYAHLDPEVGPQLRTAYLRMEWLLSREMIRRGRRADGSRNLVSLLAVGGSSWRVLIGMIWLKIRGRAAGAEAGGRRPKKPYPADPAEPTPAESGLGRG